MVTDSHAMEAIESYQPFCSFTDCVAVPKSLLAVKVYFMKDSSVTLMVKVTW